MDEQRKNGQSMDEKGYLCTCCSHFGCAHGTCGAWHGHWFGGAIIRIVLALLITAFVFWLGVKVGEVKSELYGGYGDNGYGGYMMYRTPYGYGGMMSPYGAYPAPVAQQQSGGGTAAGASPVR